MKKQSTVDQLLAEMEGLSPEDRRAIEDRGFMFPKVAAKDGENAWAYRCLRCERPGLLFVGSTFVADGVTCEEPPTSIPIWQIPWVQPLIGDQRKIDRKMPCCQHCTAELFLGPGGTPLSKMIVPHPSWEQGRLAAEAEQRASRRSRSRQNADVARVVQYDGSVHEPLPHSIPSVRQPEADVGMPTKQQVDTLNAAQEKIYGPTGLGNAGFRKKSGG